MKSQLTMNSSFEYESPSGAEPALSEVAVNDVKLPWYAVYVRAQREKVVSDLLAYKGYEAFVPTYRAVRRWSDRKVELDVPLFPGYVFMRMEIEKRLPVLTTPGVIYVVGQGKVPVALPEDEMAAIQRVLALQCKAEPHAFLKTGQSLRLRTGPLAGLEGVLVKIKAGYRLVLSIDLLQRSISAEVDLADVEVPVSKLVRQ